MELPAIEAMPGSFNLKGHCHTHDIAPSQSPSQVGASARKNETIQIVTLQKGFHGVKEKEIRGEDNTTKCLKAFLGLQRAFNKMGAKSHRLGARKQSPKMKKGANAPSKGQKGHYAANQNYRYCGVFQGVLQCPV